MCIRDRCGKVPVHGHITVERYRVGFYLDRSGLDHDLRALHIYHHCVLVTGFRHGGIGLCKQTRDADGVGQIKVKVGIGLLAVEPVVYALLCHDDKAAISGFNRVSDCGPVSYTHLDVYKRQVENSAVPFWALVLFPT